MQEISDHYGDDKFARHVGIELLDVSPGKAKAKMEIREHHLNGLGILHGAAVYSLADYVFGIASNTHPAQAVAISADITYMKAVNKGILYAEAHEVSLATKMGTYHAYVKDEEGDVIAVFQGLVYRKKQRA